MGLFKKILIFACVVVIFAKAVAAEEVIKLATLDWEPYIGQSLKNNGYAAAIVREAFKRAGYKVQMEFLPWPRALAESKKGIYDGLFPEYYDESRLSDYVYSNKFPGGPLGFYKRKDTDIKYKKLKDLEGLKIGVVRGYINTKEFDEAGYLTKEEASSDEINIKKLERGRLDLIVIDKFVAAHIISTRYPVFSDKLEFMEPPLENKPLYVVFSKASPRHQKLQKEFNAALAEIDADGTLDKILEEYGIR